MVEDPRQRPFSQDCALQFPRLVFGANNFRNQLLSRVVEHGESIRAADSWLWLTVHGRPRGEVPGPGFALLLILVVPFSIQCLCVHLSCPLLAKLLA